MTDDDKLKSGGVQAIAEERARQVQQEGWTPVHDDAHTGNELAQVASLYAWRGSGFMARGVPRGWPETWDRSWWKPTDPASIAASRRDLVKAGALIAAEIDRLDRMEEQT